MKWYRSLVLLLVTSVFITACQAGTPIDYSGPTASWPVWGGDTSGTRFSSLTQITAQNVDQLKVAWVYHTHDYPGERKDATQTTFEASPIIDDDTLYFCSGLSRAFAIDAITGKEKMGLRQPAETRKSLECNMSRCRDLEKRQ